jgi:hypothetical protein
MPDWIIAAYNTANAFATNNPFPIFILSLIALPLAKWLYRLITLVAHTSRRERLERNLIELKEYRDEDKLPHLAGVLGSFLDLTLLLVVAEVFFYAVSEFLFTRKEPLDSFVQYYVLGMYGYSILQVSKRLRRVMRPERYIAKVERRLATLNS